MAHPMLILGALAVVVPIAFVACFMIPVYIGIWYALQLVYQPTDGSAHPIGGFTLDYSRIIDQYERVFVYWQAHPNPDFMELTLPVLGPPAVGAAVGVFFLFRAARYVRSIFCVDDL